jgi:hypothetical protein
MMMSTLNKPDAIDLIDRLESENRKFREINTELLEALIRSERKLSAYVGVCSGDKELTNTILPMSRTAIAKAEARE